MEKIKAIKEDNVGLVGQLADLRSAAADAGADTVLLSAALQYIKQWMQASPSVEL